MECAHQKQIVLFARVDCIQSQCKDVNRCEFELGDAICFEQAIFDSITSFTQVEHKKKIKKVEKTQPGILHDALSCKAANHPAKSLFRLYQKMEETWVNLSIFHLPEWCEKHPTINLEWVMQFQKQSD